MKVEVLSRNCYKVRVDEWIYCQSYETIVAMYNWDLGKIVLGRKWDCSKTTLKHVKLFLALIFNRPVSKKDIDDMIEKNEITYNDMLV